MLKEYFVIHLTDFLVEQKADLNIYANLKCGGFSLKASIVSEELCKWKVECPFEWHVLTNVQCLMFGELYCGQSTVDKADFG